MRNAFYSSPKLPRLLKPEAVKETISRGLDAGLFAYVGKSAGGQYSPFVYRRSLAAADVEIADDVFLISREDAETYLATQASGDPRPPQSQPEAPEADGLLDEPATPEAANFSGFSWSGDVPHQKWMNFYTKVLSRFVSSGGLRVSVTIDVVPASGVSQTEVDETKSALRDLGASDELKTRKDG